MMATSDRLTLPQTTAMALSSPSRAIYDKVFGTPQPVLDEIANRAPCLGAFTAYA
jgi:hypothetical protein